MLLKEKNIKTVAEIGKLLTSLFLEHEKALHQCIVTYIRDETAAKDLNQELFVKLWSRREDLCHIDDLTCYLFRMAHNVCIDHLRKKKHERNMLRNEREKCPNYSNITEEFVCQREMEVLLQQAIQKLSPQCKKVYLLVKIEGLPLDKVAGMLGVSSRTIKNQMGTANLQVRNYVRKKMGENRKRKYNYNKVQKHVFEPVRILKAA